MKFKGLLVVLIAELICLPCIGFGQDVAELQKQAEQGAAGAQSKLGFCYYNGECVPQDYTEAAKWLLLAAEKGDAKAQGTLGFCYYTGKGVTQDYKEAEKWYLLGAEQGDAKAQFNLGTYYLNGRGTSPDYKEAEKWYLLAAEQGDVPAANALALILYMGVKKNFPKDLVQAFAWLNVAKIQGDKNAQGILLLLTQNMPPKQLEKVEQLSREFAERIERNKASKEQQ